MEEKFKELAYSLEVQPSDELWKRFQNKRNHSNRKPIWLAVAASLFLAMAINLFYPRTTYQLQPLESSADSESLPIVSITNYPTIDEGNGKIRVASPFN
jgi:hypothetical protein